MDIVQLKSLVIKQLGLRCLIKLVENFIVGFHQEKFIKKMSFGDIVTYQAGCFYVFNMSVKLETNTMIMIGVSFKIARPKLFLCLRN